MTTVHADGDDWDRYIGTTRPSNLNALLRRATLDINSLLIAAVYDSTDADTLAALAEAACEQADFLRSQGAADGQRSPYSTMSIGSVSLGKNKITDDSVGTFSSRAFQILADAGLTGSAPTTGWE